jgi:hypothetical protein
MVRSAYAGNRLIFSSLEYVARRRPTRLSWLLATELVHFALLNIDKQLLELRVRFPGRFDFDGFLYRRLQKLSYAQDERALLWHGFLLSDQLRDILGPSYRLLNTLAGSAGLLGEGGPEDEEALEESQTRRIEPSGVDMASVRVGEITQLGRHLLHEMEVLAAPRERASVQSPYWAQEGPSAIDSGVIAEQPMLVAEPAGKRESPPRYTNVCITEAKARSVLPSRRSLRARGDYVLRLNIGPWTPDSVVQNARPFRGDLLPPTEEGHWLEVVIASEDFHIEQRYHHVFLPRVGASYVCPCRAGGEHTCIAGNRQPYLFVPIRAPSLTKSFGEGPGSSSLRSLFAQRNLRSRQARLRIAIYYKKNLVESQLLTADVRAVEGSGTGYSSRIDYSLTSHLSDVSFLPSRDINILTNDVGDKSHKLIINGDLKEPISFNLTEGETSGALDAARQALRDISVKETKGWGATVATYNSLYGDKNEKDLDSFVTDLRTLAPLGKDLWDALFQTRPQARRMLRDRLKQSPRRPAIIQVSRVEGSSLVFPWSFIYEIPLESDSTKHTTCPLLTKGTWKPEFISTLDRCPFEQKHQKNVLCPFGFWGFNHIIEQPPSMPEGRALPLWIKRAHDKPRLVMGISLDLDPDLTEAHKNELQHQLTGLQVIPKDSLPDVEAALAEEKLELVYFYCHGRRQPLPGGKSSTPYIEVGKSQGIAPGDITTWHDSDWGVDHWKEISPLVFINGCHTAELTPEVLVNFVDSFIGVYAAGVIGTEILLVQEVANEAAEQLFIVMNNKDKTGNSFGVGEALRQMRLHFLGKGNLLGLAYTPYCSADLKLTN